MRVKDEHEILKIVRDMQHDQRGQGELLKHLNDHIHCIEGKVNQIMATEAQLLAEMVKIDAATTKQAAALEADGEALQKISDDLDKIIAAGPQGGVTDATLASLKALAARTQAVSDNLDTHATFSRSIAVKADNAVPTPVPPPVPPAP